jgi:acetyl-CoA carboxylase carboxyl transferase subunit beta
MFVMDPNFHAGSMGYGAGEKVTLLFELAARESLPVVGFTVSGERGCRKAYSPSCKWAKTSGAVKLHGDKGNLYICVLTDPTTGGVTASFAMQGDYILAEPKALIRFAGRA